jgi:hypothetical protein
MVDDERHRQLPHHRGDRHDVGRIEVQHHVPAEFADPVHRPLEQVHVRRAAEVADEVEAHPADPAFVQRPQLGLAVAPVDDGHAAVAVRTPGDGIQHRPVVGPVAARLDDDGTLDAEMGVKCRQRLLGRILGRVAAARGVGEYGTRPEHMAVRVAGTGRQLEDRSAPPGKVRRHVSSSSTIGNRR